MANHTQQPKKPYTLRTSKEYDQVLKDWQTQQRLMPWIHKAPKSKAMRWLALQGMLATTDPANTALVESIREQIKRI